MEKLSATTSCLLLLFGTVSAQTAQVERLLPQWLTGTIALVSFLFLTFVAFLVKKAWCGEKKSDLEMKVNDLNVTNGDIYDTRLEPGRRKERAPAYDNLDFEIDEDRVTPM